MPSTTPRKSWTFAFGELLSWFSPVRARVYISLDEEVQHRGLPVTGFVNIRCAGRGETVSHVAVVLNKFAPGGKTTTYTELDRQEIAEDIPIGDHDEVSVPFSIPLPDDASLSDPVGSSSQSTGCQLSVSVSFSKRIMHRTATQNIDVHPHVEIVRLFDLIESIGFRPKKSFIGYLKQWNVEEKVGRAFHAPTRLHKHLDEIAVVLHVTLASVEGVLTLDWTEHSLSEQVQSLVGGNRSQINVSWPRRVLNGRAGNGRRDTITKDIENILVSAIDGRYGASATLLRASNAPDDSDRKLLRPSGASFADDVDTLVRPVEQPTAMD